MSLFMTIKIYDRQAKHSFFKQWAFFYPLPVGEGGF